MSATLSPSRIPITQPTLVAVDAESDLFGGVGLSRQTQPQGCYDTTPSFTPSTAATSLRLPTSPALCSALRSLPLLLTTLLLAPQRLAVGFVGGISALIERSSMVTAAALSFCKQGEQHQRLKFLHSTQSPLRCCKGQGYC